VPKVVYAQHCLQAQTTIASDIATCRYPVCDVHLLLWMIQAAEISPIVPLFRQPLCAARPAAALREVAVLHDQRHVATRDTDGNLALWDVTTAYALLRAFHDTSMTFAGWCCDVNGLAPWHA
jgi:hypothetical protein